MKGKETGKEEKDGGVECGEAQGTAKAKTARVIGKRRVNVTQRTMPSFSLMNILWTFNICFGLFRAAAGIAEYNDCSSSPR